MIPISQTLPDVNLDEILAALDSDTRDYLLLLLNDGAQGLGSEREGPRAGAGDPAAGADREVRARDQRGAGRAAAQPRARRAQLLAADRRARPARHAARELRAELQRGLRDAGRPGRVAAADPAEAAGDAGDDADDAGQGRDARRRARADARGAAPGGAGARRRRCAQTRPFLRESTPIIRDEIRPFTRAALPTVQELRPAMRDLAAATPDLTRSFSVVNRLLNDGRLQPAGRQGGGLPLLAVVGQPRRQRDLLHRGRARPDPARPGRALVLDRAAAGRGRRRPTRSSARSSSCSTRPAPAADLPASTQAPGGG